MNMKTYEELVLAIQLGDILAYRDLVTRHQHGLFAFVVRITRDESVSREIVGDSFVRVYEHIDDIDVNKKFSTFLFEIAKNLAFTYLRKKKQTVSLETVEYLEDDSSFLDDMFREETKNEVRQAVSRLPQKYRTVIEQYYFEDKSYEDISLVNHIPINTVRTHIKRAKIALRKELEYEKR